MPDSVEWELRHEPVNDTAWCLWLWRWGTRVTPLSPATAATVGALIDKGKRFDALEAAARKALSELEEHDWKGEPVCDELRAALQMPRCDGCEAAALEGYRACEDCEDGTGHLGGLEDETY